MNKLLLMLSSIGLCSCMLQGTEIKVSGDGNLNVKPTFVEMRLAKKVDAENYEQAMKTAKEQINKLLEQLKALEIEEQDVKTFQDVARVIKAKTNKKGEVASEIYSSGCAAEVTIRSLDKIAAVAELARKDQDDVALRPLLDKNKLSEALQEARNLAVKDAREKADQLAKATDLKVHSVLSISETTPVVAYDDKHLSLDKEKMHEEVGLFLSHETITITIHVDITFKAEGFTYPATSSEIAE